MSENIGSITASKTNKTITPIKTRKIAPIKSAITLVSPIVPHY